MPSFKNSYPPRILRRLSSKHQRDVNAFGRDVHDSYDVEKRAFDTDDEDQDEYSDTSTSSPRTPSEAHQPMLGRVLGRAAPMRKTAGAYAHTLDRRKCHRYFTLVLGSAVVIFVLTLAIMSYSSRRVVEATPIVKPPPKAPVYEQFPFLTRYHGGIRTLVSRAENVPEYPGDEEEILESLRNASALADVQDGQLSRRMENYTIPASKPFDPFTEYPAGLKECFLDAESQIRVPKLQAYDGVVQGFPDNVMGSYDIFELNGDVCFDRFGRLGPYGLGYSQKMGGSGSGLNGDSEGAHLVWADDPEVDYTSVNWAQAQQRCQQSNQHRFKEEPDSVTDHFHNLAKRLLGDFNHDEENDAPPILQPPEAPASSSRDIDDMPKTGAKTVAKLPAAIPRQAVVIRTWNDYKYDAEDIMYLRALIAELSLASGTEYVVHILLHVKDNNLPIWSDDEVYQRVLNESLPAEFRGLATLWSEKQMSLIYAGLEDTNFRDLGVYGVYRSTYMPMQYFAHQHPEYDFFWHWEMDIRYTGHFYHLFNQVGKWAKQQPRKGLWERNGRFYVPAQHGSWEDFRQMVRVQTEHGTANQGSKNGFWSKSGKPATHENSARSTLEKPIWGPEPPYDVEVDLENDPKPPTTYDKDKYQWGVGEEADLITFNPLFDPDQTGWLLTDDVTGYDTKNRFPPRRTAIITASRLSRRMLETMHRETALKHHSMFSEMWPGSCALHHGLKAVYAPHPVFIDRRWPTDYLAATFNGGRNGASGGARTSVFEDINQRNFLGVTWYYHAGFAPNLFKRWLGYRVDNSGGEEEEMANEGRMCLPAMLLHPVKQVDLVYEQLLEVEIPAEVPTVSD